jgi:hypothetical protein
LSASPARIPHVGAPMPWTAPVTEEHSLVETIR